MMDGWKDILTEEMDGWIEERIKGRKEEREEARVAKWVHG